ncbi:UNVERIFIED_CONTAM: hypothetical protein Slati_1492700 [Sesamum latifolium]|uniref:Uncharacterized protein n=1 Tax=Sesamum latifolium TaxID=2727402 RepID=A0AAW2X6G9_9LAMI
MSSLHRIRSGGGGKKKVRRATEFVQEALRSEQGSSGTSPREQAGGAAEEQWMLPMRRSA